MDFSQIIEILKKIVEYITSLFGGSFDLSGLTDLLG